MPPVNTGLTLLTNCQKKTTGADPMVPVLKILAMRRYLATHLRQLWRNQTACDLAENVINCAANERGSSYKHEADASGDQAVLNRRRAGFVFHKTHKLCHLILQVNSSAPGSSATKRHAPSL
jgi:hypothetical protein